jgi:DNA sulfur modification protein DndB
MADLIPVIKGRMGNHDYYVGTMSFQDLSAKVQFYHDLEDTKELDSLLQRELGKRAEEMTDYLLKQKERFYGAIIVAAWGGNPNFIKVKMEDHPLLDDDFAFGLLKFDGKQKYFALDGQHRLKSIKDAIEQNGNLRDEEVAVIFLPHQQTEEGIIKTRRLFHTLNRYAKPTTSGENIALDEDNVVSIATRMLVKNHKLLSATFLELTKKNLSKGRPEHFTSLASLYEFNCVVLDAVYNFDKEYLRFRPPATHVDNVYGAISSLWIALLNQYKELQDVESEIRLANDFREPDGDPGKGNVLFRPIGLTVFGQVLAHAAAAEYPEHFDLSKEFPPKSWEPVIKRIKKLPTLLESAPWKGTIFRNNKMDNGAKGIALKIALYMLGMGDFNKENLLIEYRGHLEDPHAKLPQPI